MPCENIVTTASPSSLRDHPFVKDIGKSKSEAGQEGESKHSDSGRHIITGKRSIR
ncbi:hypothetical protein QQ045_025180 [Rhodiola kirilowii]